MRTSTTLLLLAFAVPLMATGCSGSDNRAQPTRTVRNWGPEAAARPAPPPSQRWAPAPPPTTYTAPRQPAVRTYPGPSTGGFRWHNDLASAQADARNSGKLILAVSTKPRCGLCDKFKNKIVPATMSQVERVAVGYVYNILAPGTGAPVDATLRANLRGADLMPLVGFLTPELRFVHGFYGARSTGQFQGDIAQASRLYPVSRASLGTPTTVPSPTLATVINEYGEPEWSAPGDVWPEGDPEPIDAITGAPAPAALVADAAPVAPVTVAAAPVAPAAPIARVPAPPVPPAPTAYVQPVRPVATALPRTTASVPAPPPPPAAPRAQPVYRTQPAAPRAQARIAPAAITAVERPVAWSTPSAREEPVGDEAWARARLDTALEAMRGGRFDAARRALAEIDERLPETSFAREAAKGQVALYNARRIQAAGAGTERTRILARARRDLGDSMWSVLFRS